MPARAASVIVCINICLSAIPASGQSQRCDSSVAGRFGIAALSLSGVATRYIASSSAAANGSQPGWNMSFSVEPVILGLSGRERVGGVRTGDVIVAVDGMLITSDAGGQRFAATVVGDSVRLRVRRGGGELTVAVRPCVTELSSTPDAPLDRDRLLRSYTTSAPADTSAQSNGSDDARARAAGAYGLKWEFSDRAFPVTESTPFRLSYRNGSDTSASPRVTESSQRVVIADSVCVPRTEFTSTPITSAPNAAAPAHIEFRSVCDWTARGWLGFAVDCRNCTSQSFPNGESVMIFKSSPTVAGVEAGSPAALAGLQPGDIIEAINGVLLTIPGGTSKLHRILPGERIRLSIVRNGVRSDVTMIATKRRS